MSFNVGDRVRVCDAPPAGHSHAGFWYDAMNTLCGREGSVTVPSGGRAGTEVLIEGEPYDWWFHRDWLTPVSLPVTIAGESPPVSGDTGYRTLDSGARQEFETGAVRDVQEGKGRFDLLPPAAVLRLAQLLERGAMMYGPHNWRKGMPLSRFLSSAARHLFQLIDGQEDEDHAAAVLFNVAGYIQTLEDIERERLPAALDDRRKV